MIELSDDTLLIRKRFASLLQLSHMIGFALCLS